MAIPTCEIIETCYNKKSSSWHLVYIFMIGVSITSQFTDRLHDLLTFLLTIFVALVRLVLLLQLYTSSWSHCIDRRLLQNKCMLGIDIDVY